jgi:tRNA (guanine-N7-)-methyltransferase
MMVSPRDTGDRDAAPDDGASAHARGSFFGRRKGHKLRIHQADLIDNLLPHLALDITTPAPERLAELFEGEIDDVRLEIGFGGGEHLIAEAQAFPNIGFIGCEPYVNGMAKILTQIEEHNIGNVRLYAGDAAELLAWAPPRSLARIDLIHPDPWPKRRHWKRRFVQDATVNAMARIIKAGASDAQLRFSLDRGARHRLATTVGRLHHDALRPQSRARGAGRGVSAVSADLRVEAGFISSSCPGKSAKHVFAPDVPGIHVLQVVRRQRRGWPGQARP